MSGTSPIATRLSTKTKTELQLVHKLSTDQYRSYIHECKMYTSWYSMVVFLHKDSSKTSHGSDELKTFWKSRVTTPSILWAGLVMEWTAAWSPSHKLGLWVWNIETYIFLILRFLVCFIKTTIYGQTDFISDKW